MTRLFPLLFAALFLSACDDKRRAHQATATVQIFPSPSLPHSPNFLNNQIAVLQLPALIETTSKTLGIPTHTLTSCLKISPIENSDLLTITAHHDDPTKAKSIVQALLDSYTDHRQEIQTEALQTFKEAIIKQSQVVQNEEITLPEPSRPIGIPQPHDTNTIQKTEAEMFQSAREKLTAFQNERDQIATTSKQLEKLSDDELLLHTAGLELPENLVTYYLEIHSKALKQKKALATTGLGKKHPKIVAAQESADGAMTNARAESKALQAVLKTRLELINRQIERMTKMIEEQKKEQAKLQKAEQAIQFLNQLKTQQQRVISSLKPPLIIHSWDLQ